MRRGATPWGQGSAWRASCLEIQSDDKSSHSKLQQAAKIDCMSAFQV
jgi:hypothetical protein